MVAFVKTGATRIGEEWIDIEQSEKDGTNPSYTHTHTECLERRIVCVFYSGDTEVLESFVTTLPHTCYTHIIKHNSALACAHFYTFTHKHRNTHTTVSNVMRHVK